MLIFELNFNFYALHLQVQVLHLCSILQLPKWIRARAGTRTAGAGILLGFFYSSVLGLLESRQPSFFTQGVVHPQCAALQNRNKK